MDYLEQLKDLNQNQEIKNLLIPKLNKYIKITPTDKQTIFLCLNWLPEIFYGGAAGGGKSVALLAGALQYVECPGYNALLVRDTYSNLSKPKGLIPVSHQWLRDTDAYWKGCDRMWVFPSGATLSFGHLDSPMSHYDYQSAEYHYIGVDEMVNVRENQVMYLFSSRMRRLIDQIIPIRRRGASNPPTREQLARGEWVKRRYVDDKTREDGVYFIPAGMDDNPYLDKVEYKKSLKSLDLITRRQLELGDWEIKAKGHMFSREWFEIIDIMPVDVRKTIRYWDFAATKKTKDNNPCYTAGVKLALTKRKEIIIMDVRRIMDKPRAIERLTLQTAQIDGKRCRIWIEQEPGSSGIAVIDHYIRLLIGYAVKGDRASGSKEDRAVPLSGYAEAGNVKLLKGAWNKAFLDEIELFPDGAYKDQVDAASAGFNKLVGKGGRAVASLVGGEKQNKSKIDLIIEAENNKKNRKKG